MIILQEDLRKLYQWPTKWQLKLIAKNILSFTYAPKMQIQNIRNSDERKGGIWEHVLIDDEFSSTNCQQKK